MVYNRSTLISIRDWIAKSYAGFRTAAWLKTVLFVSLFGTVFVGLALALLSAFQTADSLQLGPADACVASECMSWSKEAFSGALLIVQATGAVSAWLAAVGGIVVALLSFISSTKVSAFGNHVSHIQIFTKYMEYEISRRNKIRLESVDIYKLYSLMFSGSRGGSMEISQRYVDAWTRISEVIVASNRAYASSEGKLFSFRYHQAQLRKAFAEVGLNCAHMHHRIDFMQVEAELVSLMDSVNLVFSTNPKAGRLPKRLYV